MQANEPTLWPGRRVVVRTPDRREFRGVIVELREKGIVIRFDTGWMTTYPHHLVHPDEGDVGERRQ